MAAHPVRSSGAEPLNKPAPALGADTDDVLSDIGYDTARLAALRSKGVILRLRVIPPRLYGVPVAARRQGRG